MVTLGAATLAACGTPAPVVGASNAHVTSPSQDADAGGARRAPFDPALRASLQPLSASRPSLGHAPGRYTGSVLGNDIAKRSWEAGARSYPEGSVLAIDHTLVQPGDNGDKGPSFLMEKRASGFARFGGWRFVALDPEGQVIEDGAIESCGQCHTDAPHDFVFPDPR